MHLKIFNQMKNFEKKNSRNIFCDCTCRFDGKNITQIKTGISSNFDVNVKNQ